MRSIALIAMVLVSVFIVGVKPALADHNIPRECFDRHDAPEATQNCLLAIILFQQRKLAEIQSEILQEMVRDREPGLVFVVPFKEHQHPLRDPDRQDRLQNGCGIGFRGHKIVESLHPADPHYLVCLRDRLLN